MILYGYYMLDQLKLAGGVLDRKMPEMAQVNIDSDPYYFGGIYPLSVAVRLTYNLSIRTALYSRLGYICNQDAATIAVDARGTVRVGKNQVGTIVGVKHMF